MSSTGASTKVVLKSITRQSATEVQRCETGMEDGEIQKSERVWAITGSGSLWMQDNSLRFMLTL
jgi:hypothetical protein